MNCDVEECRKRLDNLMKSRNDLYDEICRRVENEQFIKLVEITSKTHGRNTNYKKGLYFLYDSGNVVVYVGVIHGLPNTSLYDRIRGHAGGCHQRKSWYKYVAGVKFLRIDKISKNALDVAERLAIIGMKNPIFNDRSECFHKEILDALKRRVDNVTSKAKQR